MHLLNNSLESQNKFLCVKYCAYGHIYSLNISAIFLNIRNKHYRDTLQKCIQCRRCIKTFSSCDLSSSLLTSWPFWWLSLSNSLLYRLSASDTFFSAIRCFSRRCSSLCATFLSSFFVACALCDDFGFTISFDSLGFTSEILEESEYYYNWHYLLRTNFSDFLLLYMNSRWCS